MNALPFFQAYTSQIAVIIMLALALGDDSLSSRQRREDIIDDLFQLPSKYGPCLQIVWFYRMLNIG
jgi:glucosamine--fructose-6-phosphate aminotransferase (isomerizing)